MLELEHMLELERQKLRELRKQHYQLAGDSEGYDQVIKDRCKCLCWRFL